MLLNFFSEAFLVLFFALILFYEFSKSSTQKLKYLFIFSLIFYSWGNPNHLFYLILIICGTYLFSHLIYRNKKFGAVTAGIIFLVAILAVAKGLATKTNNAIPIGVSFYSLQAMSYLMSLHKREVEKITFLELGAYLAFFPQLLAGPICRVEQIVPQLRKLTNLKRNSMEEGFIRFAVGVFKKVILADYLRVYVDLAFDGNFNNFGPYWFVIITAYSLQIYFDFSGYSDMALGLGRFFGVILPENFNCPYYSQSLTSFWRNWHKTLSYWFRDYVYVPLGGGQGKTLLVFSNILLVFILSSLWHGLGATFLVWGLLHSVVVCLEKLGKGKVRKLYPLTMITTVWVGWIFFRSHSLPQAIGILETLVKGRSYNSFSSFWSPYSPLVYLVLVGIIFISSEYSLSLKRKLKRKTLPMSVKLTLATIAFQLAIFLGPQAQEFIYFRF